MVNPNNILHGDSDKVFIENVIVNDVQKLVVEIHSNLVKAPPGPPPRHGLEWKEETHRWIRPKHETEEKPASQEFNDAVSRLSVGNNVKIIDGDKKGKLGTVDLITEDPDHGVLIEIDGEKGWLDPTNVVSIVSNSEGGQTPAMESDDERYNTAFGEKKEGVKDKESFISEFTQSFTMLGFSDLDPERLTEFIEDNQYSWEEFDAKFEDSYKNVGEYDSLLEYVKGGWSDAVNEMLREGIDIGEWDKKLLSEMQSLMSPINSHQVLFRGIKGYYEKPDGTDLKIGDEVPFDSFVSTSRDPRVAYGFIDGYVEEEQFDATTFIEIITDQSTLGITLSNEDTGFNEEETILNFGDRFVVEDIRDEVYLPLREAYDNDFVDIKNPVSQYLVIRMLPNEAAQAEEESKVNKSIARAYSAIDAALQVIYKAPPGPKPKRFGDNIIWDENKRRWVDPNKDGEPASGEPSEEFLNAVEQFQEGEYVEITEGDMAGKKGNISLVTEDPDYGVLVEVDGEKGWIDPEHLKGDMAPEDEDSKYTVGDKITAEVDGIKVSGNFIRSEGEFLVISTESGGEKFIYPSDVIEEVESVEIYEVGDLVTVTSESGKEHDGTVKYVEEDGRIVVDTDGIVYAFDPENVERRKEEEEPEEVLEEQTFEVGDRVSRNNVKGTVTKIENGYVIVNMEGYGLISYTPDELKKEEEPDRPLFSYDDRVEIISGENKGKLGTVISVAVYGDGVQNLRVKLDDGGIVYPSNVQVSSSDIPKAEPKFKKGMEVEITGGGYEGYEGVIVSIIEGTYYADEAVIQSGPDNTFRASLNDIKETTIERKEKPLPYSDPPVFNIDDVVRIDYGEYIGENAIVTDISIGADEVEVVTNEGTVTTIPKRDITKMVRGADGVLISKLPEWDSEKVRFDMPVGTWVTLNDSVKGLYHSVGIKARVLEVQDGKGVKVEMYEGKSKREGLVTDPNILTVDHKNTDDNPAPSPISEDQLLNTVDTDIPVVFGFSAGDTIQIKGKFGKIEAVDIQGNRLLVDIGGESNWMKPYESSLRMVSNSPEVSVARYDNERRRVARVKAAEEAARERYKKIMEEGGVKGVSVKDRHRDSDVYGDSEYNADVDAYLAVYDPLVEPAYFYVPDDQNVSDYTGNGHEELNRRLREDIPLEGYMPDPEEVGIDAVMDYVNDKLRESDIDEEDEKYDAYREAFEEEAYVVLHEQMMEEFSESDSEVGDLTDAFHSMYSNMKEIGSYQILYRGDKFPPVNRYGSNAESGDDRTIDTFTSTSRDPRVAESFSDGNTLFEFTVSPEVGAMVFRNEDTTHREHETVLNIGYKVIYDSIEEEYELPNGRMVNHYVKARVVSADSTWK